MSCAQRFAGRASVPELPPRPDANFYNSIDVLPFRSIGGDSETDVFGEGLTDDLIAQLSRISSLKVIGRASSMYAGASGDGLAEVADALDVAVVLTGSVRRAAGQLRVAVQVVDARTQQTLWADTYDRPFEDVFATQSDIAIRVSHSLRASMTTDEERRIQAPPTQSIEAYESFVLGRHHWFRFTGEGARLAEQYYREALQLDPDFAAANSGLANLYLMLGGAPLNVMSASEAIPAARQAAEHAIRLDPALGDAYEVLALVQGWFDLDWQTDEPMRRPSVTRADSWS